MEGHKGKVGKKDEERLKKNPKSRTKITEDKILLQTSHVTFMQNNESNHGIDSNAYKKISVNTKELLVVEIYSCIHQVLWAYYGLKGCCNQLSC